MTETKASKNAKREIPSQHRVTEMNEKLPVSPSLVLITHTKPTSLVMLLMTM